MRLFAILLLLSLVVFRIGSADENDLSEQLHRIAPTEPDECLSKFSLADGFRLELVASEPLIASPVAVEWDASGRMFVCEMRGYSENRNDRRSIIGLLQDTDQDGVYDHRTEFAGGLEWPTAIFPYKGGLFVGDAPHLYYFRDTDGDGKADEKTLVMTGFGTSNVQGLLNSFRWGLDNRIHVACSSAGGNVRRAGDVDAAAMSLRGRDISFDPNDYSFELTSGGAQHGMCFDDWGTKLKSANSDHLQQIMYEDRYVARNPFFVPAPPRISIAEDGPQAEVFRTSPVEPWRILRTKLRVSGELSGPIEGGGRAAGYFTGATGVTICRGDAWSDQMKGTAIIGDVGSNLVHRKSMVRKGIAFSANRVDQESELLTSQDNWFRPVQFANAPDGSLHVVDMYREVIEHPKSLPPNIKKHLDLTAGRDRGRIYRLVPDGFRNRVAPDLSRADTSTLVALLANDNAWHRETAARLLFERQDQVAVSRLLELTQGEHQLGRLHSLYALDGLGALNRSTLVRGLRDPHPQIRKHAIRLLEKSSGDALPIRLLRKLADDPSKLVRHQLALSMGSIPSSHSQQVLERLVLRDVDDAWMRSAIQSSLGDGAAAMFSTLCSNDRFRSESSVAFLSSLGKQILQQREAADIDSAILALAGQADGLPGSMFSVVTQLLEAGARPGEDGSDTNAEVDFRRLSDAVERMAREIARTAMATGSPEPERIRAIQSLSHATYQIASKPLESLIVPSQPPSVQRAAIVALGKFREPQVAHVLIQAWPSLTPGVQATVVDTLFLRPERVLKVLSAVEAGLVPSSMIPMDRLRHPAIVNDEKIQRLAEEILNLNSNSDRANIVALYLPSMGQPADKVRGEALFKTHCSACHRVGGLGHELGPNLTSIRSRGAESVLVNVLDPNREVNSQYVNYLALTKDGDAVSGMIRSENASSMTFSRGKGLEKTLLRVNLEEITRTRQSIMPEGFERVLDPKAMADLIFYLMNPE
ncbi:MAG: PVC-type heme-binding CxxCH protein [Planctomycetota bacterium]